MKISIIIPCFNQAIFLDKCLESIFRQKYYNWECLIIDDGSTDNTFFIAKKWLNVDNRFKYYYKENGGLGSARNYGMIKSNGDYIFFIDSDDSLEGENVFCMFSKYFNHDFDIACSDLQEIYENYKEKTNYFSISYNEDIVIKESHILEDFLMKKIPVIACNKLIKRNFLVENNISFKEGIFFEDELFGLKMFMFAKKIIAIKEITYNYNKMNINSITSKNKFSLKALDDKLIIIQEYFSFFNCQKKDIKSLLIEKILRLSDSILLNRNNFNKIRIWFIYYDKLLKIFELNSTGSLFHNTYGNKYLKFIKIFMLKID